MVKTTREEEAQMFPNTIVGLAKMLSSTYGQTALGLITFLTVWFAVCVPTLQQNRVDVKAAQDTAAQLHTTAVLLNEVVSRLEFLSREKR